MPRIEGYRGQTQGIMIHQPHIHGCTCLSFSQGPVPPVPWQQLRNTLNTFQQLNTNESRPIPPEHAATQRIATAISQAPHSSQVYLGWAIAQVTSSLDTFQQRSARGRRAPRPGRFGPSASTVTYHCLRASPVAHAHPSSPPGHFLVIMGGFILELAMKISSASNTCGRHP